MRDRIVQEIDFRRPEFRDAKPEDYEFREDGAIVRKDRWETGMRRVACAVLPDRNEWEIGEVVEVVQEMIRGPDDIKAGDLVLVYDKSFVTPILAKIVSHDGLTAKAEVVAAGPDQYLIGDAFICLLSQVLRVPSKHKSDAPA